MSDENKPQFIFDEPVEEDVISGRYVGIRRFPVPGGWVYTRVGYHDDPDEGIERTYVTSVFVPDSAKESRRAP